MFFKDILSRYRCLVGRWVRISGRVAGPVSARSRLRSAAAQPRECWCGDTVCFLPPSPEPEPPHRAPAAAVGAAGLCGWVPSCAGSLHIWWALGVTVPPPPNRRRGSFWAVSWRWQRFVSAVCVVPHVI